MERMTDKFLVQTDDGRTFEVCEYTEFVKTREFGKASQMVEGLKSLRTTDGLDVNFIQEGVYKIVELEVTAHKVMKRNP
jgi:hypothetical protein